MRRAVALAHNGLGRTAPNPTVGAVIVRDGQVLSEGWTSPYGGLHAEANALLPLDGKAPGATMYVSLEPCCWHGKTPPCTDALLNSGIRRVVVGMVDPHPKVQGRGLEILRSAGIEVQVGVEEEACRDLNAGFVKAHEQGRPRVWLKAAATLDGFLADHAGSSRWITSPEARQEGHRMRDRCDAILVGSGTLLADDPALTTRGIEGGRDALRVVIDTNLRCPDEARLLKVGQRPPLIFCAEDAPDRQLPARIVRVPRSEGGLDLAAVLTELCNRHVHNLLVEGGPHISRALLDLGAVDRLQLFLAPKVLAGGSGFLAGGPFDLADAPGFRIRGSRRVGPDLLIDLEAC
ncbi:MAG: bifunctional diaminohydroxyphosphoribosylaminopyrimidine deaminase/5-amino-6-(5-phosphoribosylamino)uracil reductase RibD [Proteobacteria bacterium]|nr:bifunctional diaminohydroxyphosphoribosylaminopyrimidine deaminase/5-amino-6-(5-phosphoribosylamino)uracil reductase RibD [Pseudomonadota bacterium]MCP4919429.1 bifunctional diaminohydroxyphosphoribosylaminopyrimidine deaminase/5-amino-6-(5-phosphoribosylamino)uracil reductase RibD [Pseudomonadota bacterium]